MVSSSSVRSIGYDAERAVLEVEFCAGNIYRYYDVPLAVYHAFMTEVMGGMASASKMEQLFTKSGGRVEAPPITQADMERLQQLQKRGFSIEWGGGQLGPGVGVRVPVPPGLDVIHRMILRLRDREPRSRPGSRSGRSERDGPSRLQRPDRPGPVA